MTYRYPQDDLGAVFSPQATTMKLWAPTAKRVSVALFEEATHPAIASTPMACDSNGIWSVTFPGNLDGKYYLYQVALPGVHGSQPTIFPVNDPYARGCSANTGRTLIYDPVKTNPKGWDQDRILVKNGPGYSISPQPIAASIWGWSKPAPKRRPASRAGSSI